MREIASSPIDKKLCIEGKTIKKSINWTSAVGEPPNVLYVTTTMQNQLWLGEWSEERR